jgi:hypothetical protein
MAFVDQALWPWHLNCMIGSANLLIRPANPDAQSLMGSNSGSGFDEPDIAWLQSDLEWLRFTFNTLRCGAEPALGDGLIWWAFYRSFDEH